MGVTSKSHCWRRFVLQSMLVAISFECMHAGILEKRTTLQGASPNIVFILGDDVGRYDLGFTGNKRTARVTRGLSSLALKEGVILANHYTHWHCSPTRRSLLTGRLPLHHGDQLSEPDEDGIDLRWTWISEKLKQGNPNYRAYYVGKGHTGYKSMDHLPTRNGFDKFAGFLPGMQSYRSSDRWIDERPECDEEEYSTALFGSRAIKLVEDHDFSAGPMFLLLCFQAVHVPYDAVPASPNLDTRREAKDMSTYHDMLREMDRYSIRLVELFKTRQQWNRTLFVFASDNGGILDGNNYPLRGEKHTSFEGGMRSLAFLSGGFIPERLRGTVNHERMHIVDWYATFSVLAGADPSDDPPLPPLPVDPANPSLDIYGAHSYPGSDSLNLLDTIFHGKSLSRVYLPLSSQVMLQGNYKIILGQPRRPDSQYGWKQPNNTWRKPKKMIGCLQSNPRQVSPCIFNILKDPSEEHPLDFSLDSNRNILTLLWHQLNMSLLTSFTSRSPKEMLGECSRECAARHWKSKCSANPKHAPICGIPECTGPEQLEIV